MNSNCVKGFKRFTNSLIPSRKYFSLILPEATIDIFREEGQLRSVSVVMPIWDKVEGDQSIIIEIPLFGTKTFVFDDIDANQAIDDAIKFFCKNSEKFGKSNRR